MCVGARSGTSYADNSLCETDGGRVCVRPNACKLYGMVDIRFGGVQNGSDYARKALALHSTGEDMKSR